MANNVVITQQGTVINCDFESAKKYLEGRLSDYQNVLFTEDTKQDAKRTVADLRKEKKELIERVKEVKKEYMKPFDEFFIKATELIDMYDTPINFINEQVEDYEKKRVEEKKLFIQKLYVEMIGDMQEFLPLQKIYNPKWENATYRENAIRKDMDIIKSDAKTAIETIKSMKSDVEEHALNMYRESLDLTKSVLYITQHEQRKAEILAREQERIRREEEERIRREERAKIEAENRVTAEKERILRQAEEERERAVETAKQEAAQEVIDSFIPNSMTGVTAVYSYRISLTDEEKEKLEMYMDSVGIEWELI